MLDTSEMVMKQRALQFGRCPECGSKELVMDKQSGEVVCSICGLVVTEKVLDQKPEWRAFTPEERQSKTRVGSPTSLLKFDKGLSTTFQPYRDTRGKPLGMKQRLKMIRLRRWQMRTSKYNSALRNLSKAVNELSQLSDKLHLPKYVEENASLIYRKILDKGLIRGRSIKSIAAASLYAACRLTGTPRSLRVIVEASSRSRKEISRCYRMIQRELEVKMPIDEPIKYVAKIASKTGLSPKTQNHAIELIRKAKKKKAISGKDPVGIAAAALYIATILNGEDITQQELAEAAGVTEVTVRNRYKGLIRNLDLELRNQD